MASMPVVAVSACASDDLDISCLREGDNLLDWPGFASDKYGLELLSSARPGTC